MGELVILAALLALAAGGSSSSTKPGRMDRPDEAPPPRAPTEQPVTLAMMEAPQPLPSTSSQPTKWSRQYRLQIEAQRTKKYQSDTEIRIVPSFKIPFHPDTHGKWLLVRAWIESDYNVVKKQHDPRASTWAWAMPLTPGTSRPPVLQKHAIPGYNRPAISWLNVGVAIDLLGNLEVFLVYPGREHTGDERGRKYDVLIEWMITNGAPPP